MDILGLVGHNRSASNINKLLAAFGNDVVDMSTDTGYGLNLAGNKVEFETFLDRVFMQDYDHIPVTYNGAINTWTQEYVARTMISRYIKKYKSKMYLGNCKFPSDGPLDKDNGAIVFPSRVFFSDLFVGNNLTWGIEWGRNGKSYLDTNIFEVANPIKQNFKTSGIKIGDPLFITNGDSKLTTKPYLVARVEPTRLYLTENLPATDTDLHFWVGSNWFDVETDDNDEITGFGKNSTNFLISKLTSLWVYNGSQLRQVSDAVGTSSHRSIINKGGYTYYFHGSRPKISGVYRFDGVTSSKVSRAVDPYVRGMSTTNYTEVTAWQEGDELRWYIGDLDNTNYNIDMDKAVMSLNTITNAIDVSPVADEITCSTTYRTVNQEDTYCGTGDAQVLKMDTGNSHNTTPIRLRVETKVYYPAGTDMINDIERIQIIGRQTRGLKVGYKLWNDPYGVDDTYKGLGECSDDRSEFTIPDSHNQASGISFEFSEMGTLENDTFLEKIIIFYNPIGRRLHGTK